MTNVAPNEVQETNMDEIGMTEDRVKNTRKERAARKVTMRLLRNYRPDEGFETVGHWVPAVIVRNKLGKEEELYPAKFVEGEVAPPPQAGVGFDNKIWANTLIRVSPDEAKRMKSTGVGEVEID